MHRRLRLQSFFYLALVCCTLVLKVQGQDVLPLPESTNQVEQSLNFAAPAAPAIQTQSSCRQVGVTITTNTCNDACRYRFLTENDGNQLSEADLSALEQTVIPSLRSETVLSRDECRGQCFLEVYLTFPANFSATLYSGVQICQQRGYRSCFVSTSTNQRYRDASLNVCNTVFPRRVGMGTVAPTTTTTTRTVFPWWYAFNPFFSWLFTEGQSDDANRSLRPELMQFPPFPFVGNYPIITEEYAPTAPLRQTSVKADASPTEAETKNETPEDTATQNTGVLPSLQETADPPPTVSPLGSLREPATVAPRKTAKQAAPTTSHPAAHNAKEWGTKNLYLCHYRPTTH